MKEPNIMEPLPFTDEELLELGETMFQPNKLWSQAFNYYNSDSSHKKKLPMRCTPCYKKVLVYLLRLRFSQ